MCVYWWQLIGLVDMFYPSVCDYEGYFNTAITNKRCSSIRYSKMEELYAQL